MVKDCKKHGMTDHSGRPDCKYYRCRKCMVESVTKRRRKLKLLAVEYKGGRCERCGYNKCVDALDFHHLDPSTKDFNISKNGNTRSWDEIRKEVDKCIMICANCHREEHSSIGS